MNADIINLSDFPLRFTELQPKSKKPKHKDWTQHPKKRDDIKSSQVGLLTGKVSGGAVDVDLDSPEAIALADLFLDKPTMTFGKESTPTAHRVCNCPGIDYELFQDPAASGEDKRMLLELRGGTGDTASRQTMFASSEHPNGKKVIFARETVPAQVEQDWLTERCRWIAAFSLLARHCWHEGNRDNLSVALTGVLLGDGWEPELIDSVIRIFHDLNNPNANGGVNMYQYEWFGNARILGMFDALKKKQVPLTY